MEIDGVVNGGVPKIGDGVIEIAANSESVKFLSDGTGGLELDACGSAYPAGVRIWPPVGRQRHAIHRLRRGQLAGATLSYTSAPCHTSGVHVSDRRCASATVTLVGTYSAGNSRRWTRRHVAITDPTTSTLVRSPFRRGRRSSRQAAASSTQGPLTDGRHTRLAQSVTISTSEGAAMVTWTGQLYECWPQRHQAGRQCQQRRPRYCKRRRRHVRGRGDQYRVQARLTPCNGGRHGPRIERHQFGCDHIDRGRRDDHASRASATPMRSTRPKTTASSSLSGRIRPMPYIMTNRRARSRQPAIARSR